MQKKVNTEFYASRKSTIMAMCRMNESTYVCSSYTHNHPANHLFNIIYETFSCHLTTLFIFSCLAWLNASDKQTSCLIFETVTCNDPSFLLYIMCVISVTTSLQYCVLVLRIRFLIILVYIYSNFKNSQFLCSVSIT